MASASSDANGTQRASAVSELTNPLVNGAGKESASPLPSALHLKWGWNIEAGLTGVRQSDLDLTGQNQSKSSSSKLSRSGNSDSKLSFGAVLVASARIAPVSRT